MKKILAVSLCLLSFQLFSQSNITVGSTTVEVDTIYTGLDIPWEIIYGPDGFIWTTERKGIISRIDPVAHTKTLFLSFTKTLNQGYLEWRFTPILLQHQKYF